MSDQDKMTLRYGELFAGVGGLSLGFERAGWECAFHAEWDAFPRQVLKHRWPNVPLYGDVSMLDGAQLVQECGPIHLLSGGAPCQDLSLAGRRKGFDGTRSVLFFDLIRLWNETHAEFCLYENVVGALSSNQGADFARVLGAFVGDDVGVPTDAKGRRLKWANAGVVCGPEGVAAWRIFDAQYWGVAQRRRRVFVLCSRTGVVDPAEILFEFEGLQWHPEAGGPTGQEAPDSVGDRAAARLRTDDGRSAAGVIAFQERGRDGGPNLEFQEDIAYALTSPNGGSRAQEKNIVSYAFDSTFGVNSNVFENQTPPIKVGSGGNAGNPPAMVQTIGFYQEGGSQNMCTENVSPTLKAPGQENCGSAHAAVLAFDRAQITHPLNGNRVEPGLPMPPLAATGQPCVAYAVNSGSRAEVVEEVAASLRAGERAQQAVARIRRSDEYVMDDVSSTISARDYKSATDIVVDQVQVGRPRRLLPVECERLMGWPDDWTNVPNEKGKPASDAVRYKAIGNGVVSHIPHWIGERLWWAYAGYLHHEWWSTWAQATMDGQTRVNWAALREQEELREADAESLRGYME